ncbi:RNA exonuclease 4 [Kwoniella heveanensis CBS 569]|nr:RNA exonuclease 4 [Kwoniella heveanensis CBS 569]
MVGLGPMGSESALARVSIVNYHGHILLDTFVQPREKVTDWRTWISGIREDDVLGAPEFEEVQKQVAELVEGRILVGHAIDNDLKVLLLSHPRPLIRDTQKCKMLREKAKNKHPGLKKLSEIELGVQIQKASHSSVTDARATMALYRIHKVEWERQLHHATEAYRAQTQKTHAIASGAGSASTGGKRKRGDDDDDANADSADEGAADMADEGESVTTTGGNGAKGKKKTERVIKSFPGGGRKGISSGLGLIIRRNGQRIDGTRATYTAGSGRGRRDREAEPSSSGGGSGAGKWWEQDAS